MKFADNITIPSWPCGVCWVINTKKSELNLQEDFNFIGYQFDLLADRVTPTQVRWVAWQQREGHLHSQKVHVPDRSDYSNGKTGLVRSPSYEASPVASEDTGTSWKF